MQRKAKCRWLKILLAALPMVAVMVVIFVFSGSAGGMSSAQSNAVGEWLLGVLGIEIPAGQSASDVDIFWGFTVRECAHVFLYFCLGASAVFFVAALSAKALPQWRPSISAGGAVIISLIYACLDELHQSFVAGRDGTFADVGIDAIGFVLASLLCMAVWYLMLAIRTARKTSA